jgi:multiple sugar transport system permease protein
MAAITQKVRRAPQPMPQQYSRRLQGMTVAGIATLFAIALLVAYLSPFGYMVATSLKSRDQIANGRLLPQTPRTYIYTGPENEELRLAPGDPLDVFTVPLPEGDKVLAMARPGRAESTFIDPENPDGGLITWEGSWRTLPPAYELDPEWNNFSVAWEGINEATFPILVRNTLVIAVFGLIGTTISSILVAYAFARFPLPRKNLIFMILIATIILPRQVTLVPTYAFFERIGWTGTWLPLIVPHFFANAYNVFLLRQYFMTLPRELDEAAMIDGADPLRVLWSIIIPQSYPAIIAVMLFHFVFAWNDYFEPLIYLLGKRDLVPVSVGIQQFNFVYDQQPELIQATALLGLTVPVLLFFFAQRVFMRGVVVTGVDK